MNQHFRKVYLQITAMLMLISSVSYAANAPKNYANQNKAHNIAKAQSEAATTIEMPQVRWDLIAENAAKFTIPTNTNVKKNANLAAQELGPCDCPCESIPITAANFQVGGVGPLVVPYAITAPGVYKLCEDIAYNPAAGDTFAIYILSSNVDLDLNGHTLSLATGNAQYTSGVLIAPTTENVSIVGLDSTIENFAIGIYSPGPSDIITLRDITVQNCGSDTRSFGVFPVDGGIILGATAVSPVNPVPVTDVLITNVRALNNKNFGMIVQSAAENAIVKNCIIDGTYSEAPSFYIIGLIVQATTGQDQIPRLVNAQVADTTVTNTICKTITSFAPTAKATGVIGAFFGGINNLRVAKSTFSNTESAAFNNNPICPYLVFSAPYVQSGIANYSIEDCFFADAVGDPWTFGAECFHSSANSTGLQLANNRSIKNCVSSGSVGYNAVAGFDVAYGSNLLMENCQSMNHKTLGTPSTIFNLPQSVGYLFNASAGDTDGDPRENNIRGNLSQVLVRNCIASEIEANFGPAIGFLYATGNFHKYLDQEHTELAPAVFAKNISFIDCVAQKCIAHADTSAFDLPVKAIAAGFMAENGVLVNYITTISSSDFNINNPEFYKLPESLSNVLVQNCYVTDIHGAEEGKCLTGGIVMLAVTNATITGNTVSAINNAGILLCGGRGAVPNITNGEFRPTKRSLVEKNTCTNSIIGFKNINKKYNAFVDNISYYNKQSYVHVDNVARNNNRSF